MQASAPSCCSAALEFRCGQSCTFSEDDMIMFDCNLHHPCVALFSSGTAGQYVRDLSLLNCSAISKRTTPTVCPRHQLHTRHQNPRNSNKAHPGLQQLEIKETSQREDTTGNKRVHQLTLNCPDITPFFALHHGFCQQWSMQDNMVFWQYCYIAKIAVSECRHDLSQS